MADTTWVCKKCKTRNKLSRTVCRSCSKKRKIEDIKKQLLEGGTFKQVQLSECVPNTWNPNHMRKDTKGKLWKSISAVLSETVGKAKAYPGKNVLEEIRAYLPPIVVRRYPGKAPKGVKYQIIDGEQRWTVIKDHQDDPLIQEHYAGVIDAIILNLSDKQARIMTSTLNWLRGDADPDKYAVYLKELTFDSGLSVEELAEQLPESTDELESIISAFEIPTREVVVTDDEEFTEFMSRTGPEDDERLVTMNFPVRIGQADVIQRELQRIIAITGVTKNAMGNALEKMAVLSSQTPDAALEATAGEILEVPDEEDNITTIKKKLKKKKDKG